MRGCWSCLLALLVFHSAAAQLVAQPSPSNSRAVNRRARKGSGAQSKYASFEPHISKCDKHLCGLRVKRRCSLAYAHIGWDVTCQPQSGSKPYTEQPDTASE